MNLFSRSQITKSNYFSFLFALIPVSFMAGNMIININVILIILSSLILFNKRLIELKFLLLDKLIFVFFFLILISGFLNDIGFYLSKENWSQSVIESKGFFSTSEKSILFLKYLFLYLTVRYLIEKKIVNLKIFFLMCAASSLFVCFDIFYQLVNGEDIFGLKAIRQDGDGNFVVDGRKLSGPFGDELIAGGFIQRFSLFTFFILPLFYKKISKTFSKYLIPIFFIIFLAGIILSGNRMPFILFLMTIFLILLFQAQTRKFFFPFIIVFSICFFIILNFNNQVRLNFTNFFNQISKMTTIVVEMDFDNRTNPQYLREFASFYDTWLMNKYVGGGIKNFRYYCHHRPNIQKNTDFVCNMHPHNYYLEILTETGIIGFINVSLIFLMIFYLTFFKKYFLNSNLKNNHIITPFIFLFFAEIFPLKSTGSFFTTGNATYIFLLISILVSFVRSENLIENKY